MENNSLGQYKNHNRFFLGSLLIIVGGLLLASKLGVPIPVWIFSWQFFLIVLGLYVGIKRRFQNGGWLILVAVGTFYLLDDWSDMNIHQFLLPGVIILTGILFILYPKRNIVKYGYGCRNRMRKMDVGNNSYNNSSYVHEGYNGDEIFFIDSVFSGIKRNILSKNFKRGDISCVFGGVELNFMQADIQGVAILKLNQAFGGLQLIVPSNWTVQNKIEGSFQGIEDKRRVDGATDPDKVLVLMGSSVFAGIEIKSY